MEAVCGGRTLAPFSSRGSVFLGMDLLAFRLGQLFPLYLNTMFKKKKVPFVVLIEYFQEGLEVTKYKWKLFKRRNKWSRHRSL